MGLLTSLKTLKCFGGHDGQASAGVNLDDIADAKRNSSFASSTGATEFHTPVGPGPRDSIVSAKSTGKKDNIIGRTVNGVPVLGSSARFNDIDKKSYREVDNAANLLGGWSLEKITGSGIHIFTKPSDFGGGAKQVCGKARVDCSPEKFLAEISDYNNWPKWDPVLKSHHERELELGHMLIRLELAGMFPVSGRESVYLESKIINEEDNSIAFAGYSIEHEDWPITKKLVRVEIIGGGWHIKPVDGEPDKCDVTYLMNVDPKLKMVPQFIMNLVVVRFPGIIDKVRKGLGVRIPNGKGNYHEYDIEGLEHRRRKSSVASRKSQ